MSAARPEKTPAALPHVLTVEMVLPSLDAGGQELVVSRLARQLAARGHDVGITLTIEEGGLAAGLRAMGHDVAVVPTLGLRTNWRAPSLISRFRGRRPDVVHVHSGVWLKAARAARAAGVPRIVHTVHGLLDKEPWHGEFLKRIAAHHTDIVVAVSEPLRRYLIDVARVPKSRVITIENGIDATEFRPGPKFGELRRRLNVSEETFLVGHVARLAPVKNQLMLLEAFAGFRRSRPDARLAIVGDGPERSAIEARINELSLVDAVRMLGEVADTAPLYREFDVFVLSSRAEGTSMSILEALASGVCVVATNVGGNPNLLRNGECGILVPSDDPQSLGDALMRIASDDGLRRACAEAGRRHVELNYSDSSVVDRYCDLYRGGEGLDLEIAKCVG